MKFKESMIFLKRFAGNPGRIGSVTPSSRFLTRAMLSKVDWKNAKAVAELGAGTGVFTREIVKRARPDAKIFVFEIDPDLQAMIKNENHEHKGLRICSDAQELNNIIKSEGIEFLDAVLSSLPFTVLPADMTKNILDAVQLSLKPDGNFVAYQYSSIMKKKLIERFAKISTSFVLFNIPPAFVYDCRGDKR